MLLLLLLLLLFGCRLIVVVVFWFLVLLTVIVCLFECCSCRCCCYCCCYYCCRFVAVAVAVCCLLLVVVGCCWLSLLLLFVVMWNLGMESVMPEHHIIPRPFGKQLDILVDTPMVFDDVLQRHKKMGTPPKGILSSHSGQTELLLHRDLHWHHSSHWESIVAFGTESQISERILAELMSFATNAVDSSGSGLKLTS